MRGRERRQRRDRQPSAQLVCGSTRSFVRYSRNLWLSRPRTLGTTVEFNGQAVLLGFGVVPPCCSTFDRYPPRSLSPHVTKSRNIKVILKRGRWRTIET